MAFLAHPIFEEGSVKGVKTNRRVRYEVESVGKDWVG